VTRKPQSVTDQAAAERAATPSHPWDYPATCEICTTPEACFKGQCPCELSGESAGTLQATNSDTLPPPAVITPDLIKAIAMDIGKDVVAYVEVMYPQAITATSSTFRLSLRNCIYNEIMAALAVSDETLIKVRLVERKAFRRLQRAAWQHLRGHDWDKRRAAQDATPPPEPLYDDKTDD
jgi:hypothetical protein